MIACPTVTRDRIRRHYDLLTPFYWLLWGRHVHHGLWDGVTTAKAAQQNLVDVLARAAGLREGEVVVDVGCGMGGSAIHLAQAYGCHVRGVTLSRLQAAWARWAARWEGAGKRTEFQCADAEAVTFPDNSFDVLWSIECTEHLFDKPGFLERAARWLRPGGRVAICAWLAGDALDTSDHRQQVYDVCEGFLCPSLGTADDYAAWLERAGLQLVKSEDWTEKVAVSWQVAQRRIRRSGLYVLAPLIDRDTVSFLSQFDTIVSAYRCGAMKYGCFVAEKPREPGSA